MKTLMPYLAAVGLICVAPFTTALAGPAATPVVLGDFNHDGETDFLWRDDARVTVSVWIMVDGVRTASGALADPGSDWAVRGAADMDGDGDSDIVWQNTVTGQIVIWFMDAAARTSAGAVPNNPGAAWGLGFVTDTSGDEKGDFVFRHTDGRIAIWTMDGTTRLDAGVMNGPGNPDWVLAGVGSFDVGETSDLYWRLSSDPSTSAVWFINGVARTGTASFPTPGAAFELGGLGDLDDDGDTDFVWESAGAFYAWLMNGTTRTSAGAVAAPGSDWDSADVSSFSTAGNNGDILLRNMVSGQPVVWEMSGVTRTGSQGAIPNPGTTWGLNQKGQEL